MALTTTSCTTGIGHDSAGKAAGSAIAAAAAGRAGWMRMVSEAILRKLQSEPASSSLSPSSAVNRPFRPRLSPPQSAMPPTDRLD